MPHLDVPLDGPLDLVATLAPLARGNGDRTIRIASDRAWWTTRTSDGPATVSIIRGPRGVVAEAWGPGADVALARAATMYGPSTDLLADGPDERIGRLARRHRGVRILRTGSVLDALVAAIVEQKVTGTEAHRVWNGLVRDHGEPAPGPSDLGLRVFPAAATLAALPYWAYHELGLERRRADLIRAIAARPAAFEAVVELPLADAHARLLAVPGVGPWTVAEVAVRALGDVDAVSVGDFHLPNLVAWALAGEPRGDDARMLELLEPYRGRRALAVRLLELSGIRAPSFGPRLAPRRIEGI
ncbi:MAG: DNA-3-methyladenine glycosylase family protein [Candidatus Limnocylindrales bacterium]